MRRASVALALATLTAGLGVFSRPAPAASHTVGGLSPSFGQWTYAHHVITANNAGLSTNLVNQFVYQHNPDPNATLLRVRIRVHALPAHGPYTIGLVDHSAANGNGQYKWSLDLTNRGLELINDGFQVVSRIPYRIPLHRWVSMELLVSDNVLNGKVWTGSRPPKGWMVSGRFFRGLARTQPDAGLYAAHADVSFSQFQILPLGTLFTAQPATPAGVFAQGSAVVDRIAIHHPGAGAASLRLVAQAVDANGHGSVQSRPVKVAPHGSTSFDVRFPFSRLGWYGVQYNLVNSATGQVVESLPQIGAAIVPPPLTPPSRRIAMNISVVSWYYPPSVRSQDIALEFRTLQEQGMGTLRLEFNSNLLPNWVIYDPMMLQAYHYHMHVLGILDSWPTGKNPFVAANHLSFASAVTAYENAVRAIVNRYRPGGTFDRLHHLSNTVGITQWEIWNEPSIPSRWGGTMTQYGQLVKATAKAVRAVEPHAFLLEYAHHDKTVYQASGDVFSGLAIHYYPGVVPPENSHFPITNAVNHNLTFLHQEHLPPILWMTEVGWNTRLVNPIQQAEYDVRAALESLSAGSGPVYLFIQNFLNSGMGDQHLNFTPKPAYSAVLTVARMVRGYNPSQTLVHGPFRGEIWTGGSDLRLIVWMMGSATVTKSEPNVTGLQATNWMGNLLHSSTLSLSGRPLYLTVANTAANRSRLTAWFQGL